MVEQRKSPHIQEKADVTVTVQSSPEAPELEDRVFSCYSSDVSLEGIKMRIDTDIPCDAILVLEIFFSNSPERHLQMGYVIWCDGCVEESLEGDWYNIGIRFDQVTNPKFSPWREAVSLLIEKSQED
jgi:hypothetical protein